MKRLYLFIGYAIGLSIPAAFVYGFWLIHHGLGFIAGAVVVVLYVNYYSPTAAKRREAAELSHGISTINEIRQRREDAARHRGIN